MTGYLIVATIVTVVTLAVIIISSREEPFSAWMTIWMGVITFACTVMMTMVVMSLFVKPDNSTVEVYEPRLVKVSHSSVTLYMKDKTLTVLTDNQPVFAGERVKVTVIHNHYAKWTDGFSATRIPYELASVEKAGKK